MIFRSARWAEPQPEIDLELGVAASERREVKRCLTPDHQDAPSCDDPFQSVTLTLWGQRMSMI